MRLGYKEFNLETGHMSVNLGRMANTVNKTLLLNALFLSTFELDLSFKFHLKI